MSCGHIKPKKKKKSGLTMNFIFICQDFDYCQANDLSRRILLFFYVLQRITAVIVIIIVVLIVIYVSLSSICCTWLILYKMFFADEIHCKKKRIFHNYICTSSPCSKSIKQIINFFLADIIMVIKWVLFIFLFFFFLFFPKSATTCW